jgi:hypothetical protein
MFEGNILTVNPGLRGSTMEHLDNFDDVRAIQAHLIAQGLDLTVKTDPDGTGPAEIMLTDPDGNTILIDQHI